MVYGNKFELIFNRGNVHHNVGNAYIHMQHETNQTMKQLKIWTKYTDVRCNDCNDWIGFIDLYMCSCCFMWCAFGKFIAGGIFLLSPRLMSSHKHTMYYWEHARSHFFHLIFVLSLLFIRCVCVCMYQYHITFFTFHIFLGKQMDLTNDCCMWHVWHKCIASNIFSIHFLCSLAPFLFFQCCYFSCITWAVLLAYLIWNGNIKKWNIENSIV